MARLFVFKEGNMRYQESGILTITQREKMTAFDGNEFILEFQPLSNPPARHVRRLIIGDAELEAHLDEEVLRHISGSEDAIGVVAEVKKNGLSRLYLRCAPVPWEEVFELMARVA
jgi:hypothetical protein